MKINGKTRTIGLIGCPVEHTLSPAIHNYLSRVYQQDMAYLPFLVSEDGVLDAVKGAYALGILGLNVTVPHKQAVMGCLVEVDSVARAVGAVNTLVRTEGGYKGYNTDMEGLRRAVLSEGISLVGKTVVILGAGGASKAVCYMCLLEKAEKIYLLNRTFSKAKEIADYMNGLFSNEAVIPMLLSDYGDIRERDLYVFQATSLGLSPHEEETPISDPVFYRKAAVGFDLIYNPAQTRFMKLIKEAGGRAYNGLKMLLYQGMLAYSYWTGIPFETLNEVSQDIYEILYQQVYRKDNLVLIGFMGAGKTSVGKALSKRLSYDFIDTDAYIEEQAGMSIADIFKTKGEAYFRKLETDTISELLRSARHTVFATGGGMPLRQENTRLLRLLGKTVYLNVSAGEAYSRLKGDTKRPLLMGDSVEQKIEGLLSEREPLYEACGNFSVAVDGRNIKQIVDEILWRAEI